MHAARTIVLTAAVLFAAQLPAGDADVSNLLKDLQHAEFDVRERAVQALIKAGEPARGPLDALLKKGADKELAAQIQRIVVEQEKELAPAQREKNEAAYKAEYLPQAETLRAQHKNHWLAIANGKLLPADAAGKPAPADSLQAADAAAEKVAPYAAHRFVFKIGDEGDIKQELGATDSPSVVGCAFIHALPGKGWGVADGLFQIMDGVITIQLGVKGTDDRPHVEPELLAPQGAVSVKQLAIVATGFEGTAVLLQKNAAALRLQRWEIPGKATLNGIFIKSEGRRAYTQLRFAALKEPLLLPVCIWRE